MPLSQKPSLPHKALVSPLFLQAMEKLKSLDINTISATEADSGPLYTEWRQDSRNFDFPELSALFRLSKILPDNVDEIARSFFKPAALTVIEVCQSQSKKGPCRGVKRGHFG